MKDSFQMLSICFSSQVAPPFSRASAFPGTPEDKMITASMQTRVKIIFLIIMGKDDWRSKTLKWIKARRSIRQILETTWSHKQCMLVSSIPCHGKWNSKVTNRNACLCTADMLSLCRWTTILLSHYPSADLDTILSLFEMIKVPFHISLFRSLCEDRLRFLFCCFILCTMYQTKNHVDYYAVAKEGGPKCSPNRK